MVVEDDDYVVHRVRVGREAIGEKFADIVLNVAFIDLGLPDVSGDRVVTELRQRYPLLATILMTGWHLEDKDPRLQACDHRIQKPFSLNQARQIVTLAVG